MRAMMKYDYLFSETACIVFFVSLRLSPAPVMTPSSQQSLENPQTQLLCATAVR